MRRLVRAGRPSAAGLFTGAMTGVGSSGLFVGTWMAVAGLGTGIAMSAALVELSADKSGIGAAVLQAVNKIGGRSASPCSAVC